MFVNNIQCPQQLRIKTKSGPTDHRATLCVCFMKQKNLCQANESGYADSEPAPVHKQVYEVKKRGSRLHVPILHGFSAIHNLKVLIYL